MMRATSPDLDRQPSPSFPQERRGRRLRRVLAILVFVSITMIGLTGIASATAFSPYLPPQAYTWGDCTIKSGPVKDELQNPYGFAAIGGGTVSCASPHTIQLWVQEYFALPGQQYYAVGNTGYTSGSNTYGMGGGIQQTSRICGSGYWYTVTTVSVSGWGAHAFPSTANQVVARGRSAALC